MAKIRYQYYTYFVFVYIYLYVYIYKYPFIYISGHVLQIYFHQPIKTNPHHMEFIYTKYIYIETTNYLSEIT